MMLGPPTTAGPVICSNDLSSAFASVESNARCNPAQAFIAANGFLASHAARLLKNAGAESILAETHDPARMDTDLLWLTVVEEVRITGSHRDYENSVCREMLSLARPEARRFIAFAPVAGAVACIVAPLASVKLSISPLSTTGLPGLEFRELTVELQWNQAGDGVQLASAPGNDIFYQIAAEKWLLFSAMILGVAQSAFEYILDYSRKRISFGRAIGHHQAVALKLADIAIALESSRLLCQEACASGNTGLGLFQKAEYIWCYVKDIPRKTASQTMQVMGGHGYLQQHPVQQWFCDLQLLAIAGELPDSLAAAVKHD